MCRGGGWQNAAGIAWVAVVGRVYDTPSRAAVARAGAGAAHHVVPPPKLPWLAVTSASRLPENETCARMAAGAFAGRLRTARAAAPWDLPVHLLLRARGSICCALLRGTA
jgi:hypothetical protein